jgi:hypothetical protein
MNKMDGRDSEQFQSDSGATHDEDSRLPDPEPAYVPAGFEPFPNHLLRGVSQPLLSGRKPSGWSSETAFLARQYVVGLID